MYLDDRRRGVVQAQDRPVAPERGARDHPAAPIQEMKTNDLYLLERRMHYEGKPIEIRPIINVQKELKQTNGENLTPSLTGTWSGATAHSFACHKGLSIRSGLRSELRGE